MILRITISALITATFLFQDLQAQIWVDMMEDGETNFHKVQAAFNQAWEGREYEKGQGWKQYKRWEYFMEPRVYPSGERQDPSVAWNEAKRINKMAKASLEKAATWTPLGPTDWTTVSYNPGQGRVNVVLVDPSNSNIIYAGVPAGGLWKSINNGASWEALMQDQPTLGVSGIAVDHNNSDIIYVSTGDGDGSDTYSNGVLKSTNGGGTWASTGLNWSTTQSRTTHRLIMDPANSNRLFCATTNGLYRTTDAGSNWTMVQDGNMRDVEFKPGDPNTVYCSSTRFFRSEDGGDNWSQINGGLPPGAAVNRVGIAVSPDEPNWVYTLMGDDDDGSFYGLYLSSNSGQNWTEQSDSPNIFSYSDDGGGSGGQSWYDMALAVDPTNASTVYVGGINVWKSTNAGVNWNIRSHWVYPSSIGYTHADIHTLDMFGSTLFCGSDGGLFRSNNGADDWNDISSGMQIMQLYRLGGTPQNADLVISGSQDNGCNLYDGSGTWLHVQGADGMESAIDPTNENTMYFSSQNGSINRSYDGGQSYSGITWDIAEDGGWVTPYLLDPDNPNTLYAGFQNIWRSNNQGDDWTQLSFENTSRTIRSLAIATANNDYIAWGNSNDLFLTTDGGNNWDNINGDRPDLSCTYLAFHPQDDNIIYATFSGYDSGKKVYVTTDAGTIWQNISGNLPNLPVNCISYQNGTQGGIYVGTDIGIFYTDSTLSNWQPFNDGLPNVIVNELEIHYPTNKLRAATFGRGLWESPLYAPSNTPPVAQFTYGNTLICAGDSVQFFDASLDAEPGWTWEFPGATPATSIEQNPWVNFPTAGTYSVTMTMTNANGNDSQTQQVEITIPPNEVQLTIVLDNYPGETSWIVESEEGELMYSGGPFDGLDNGSQVDSPFCLPYGCFTFTILDNHGDGICCGQGNGSYTVSNTDMGTIASGGEFEYSESTAFCLDNTVGVIELDAAEIQIIPNPNNGQFSVDVELNGSVHLEVIDALGRIVLDQDFLASGNISRTIDIQAAPSGIYLLRLESNSGVSVTRILKE